MRYPKVRIIVDGKKRSLLMFGEIEERAEGRLAGVTAIALTFTAYAMVAAIYALLLGLGRVAMSSGAWLIGGGLEIMGKWIFVVYAAVHAACGFGLWRMEKWALRLASLLLLWGLLQVTPAISSAVADSRVYAVVREGLQIVWRVVALRYLWSQTTRDSFR
jgi:hypothetical protein